MNNKVTVERAERKDGRLWLHVDDVPVPLANVTPKRHMLVDSDGLAFVYILETADRFLYVIIPRQWWPELKAAFAKEETIWLESGGTAVELEQFGEELAYLLENIRGNANYGETLERSVQEVFFAE
ncbi:hypothetical protein GS3922_05865 [Geobacillus subterraneus]|uniref:UPF0738 protein GS3922_05865 n=2 Tax=Geobacillus TaxID=129337 RepID=A0ABM6AAB6_9BACL|nr:MULTISPECIES: hypothetical protein [Geobacillus]AMX83244.1 hypothetical protein GS3922_05865 [Geobacillus subterraneus]KZS25502.1 hypothetical protein A5418_02915 [Geobacillus subterraneus]OXB90231.1 hypothetical protein B9L21_05540 [Geobacillus uzenensis]QIZ66931.1 hypothetical protein HF500_06445 [Geobacillus subterraneus]WPZ19157.1 hypothetical protein UM396_04350 [Geobacillus subterraneus]